MALKRRAPHNASRAQAKRSRLPATIPAAAAASAADAAAAAMEAAEAVAPLSAELRQSLEAQLAGGGAAGALDDSNALILPGKKKEKKAAAAPSESKKKRRLTNREAKKLRKLLEKSEKKKQRTKVLESLNQHALRADQAKLLAKSSAMASGKLTAREQMREELQLSKAGVELPKRGKSRLLVARESKSERDWEEAQQNDSDSSDDDALGDDDKDDGDDDGKDEGAAAADSAASSRASVIPQEEAVRLLRLEMEAKAAAERRARKKTYAKAKPSVFVQVDRDPEIQARRLQLPILREEHAIVEAIRDSPVVIICGETGSGKTTQVPQFLYEAGFTQPLRPGGEKLMIGVTEPRRIAATSMAARVATEMGLGPAVVSSQVRFQSTVTDQTELKFMTDGVLAKEIESDFALRKYSVIIVDEAHERSAHTDILLGLLSRIVPQRAKMARDAPPDAPIAPLKLVIMSATLRVEEFTKNTRLFPKMDIPVLSVDARQFPVTTHFSKKTRVDTDATSEAAKKVSQIHKQLPAGGILVFMTGQAEIVDLCRRLRDKFPAPKAEKHSSASNVKGKGKGTGKDAAEDKPPAAMDMSGDMEEISGELDSESEDEDDEGGAAAKLLGSSGREPVAPLHVLPLYSNLATAKQAKIFEPVPAGHRLCVVATNVAETSLTIPGIRYVVDTGLMKDMVFDKTTGVSSFEIRWTSKASADQRAGRAGRTSAGHCYRLFSSAIYQHDFPQFSDPEILRIPADGLVLQMKNMNIDLVTNFPFPTPPDSASLKAAEKLLIQLGALDAVDKRITPLGRAMVRYPVAPRYAKMLTLARHYDCQSHVVAIVAALTVKNVFQFSEHFDDEDDEDDDGDESGSDKMRQRKRVRQQAVEQWRIEGLACGGDLGALLRAIGACDFVSRKSGKQALEKFCAQRLLRFKAILEARKLRRQLTERDPSGISIPTAANADEEEEDKGKAWDIEPPRAEQDDAIRQIVLAAFGDRVARLGPDQSGPLAQRGMFEYYCDAVEDPIYIHPSSVLARQKPAFVVYHELFRGKKRLYMKGVTVIQVEWLSRLVPSLCTFSKPLESPAPYYDAKKDDVRCCMSATYGKSRWPVPAIELSFPQTPDRYRYFARFLLEGRVFPVLEKFVPLLKNKPNIFNKPWVKDRVVAVLQPLVDNKIDSRAKLIVKWSETPLFLLQPYTLWLDTEHHSALTAVWPPSKHMS